jgi:hypothetical protein
MNFSIPQKKTYIPPPIQMQPLVSTTVNVNVNAMGNIFKPIYPTGPCTSCGK